VIKRPSAFVLPLCVLAVATAASLGPADAAESTGTVSGTVTDAEGTPLAGIRVGATWRADGPDSPDLCCFTTETEPDGSYELDQLEPGEYTLQFHDTQQRRYAGEWWDDAASSRDASRFRVGQGESIGGFDAVLDELAHVSGQVRGVQGATARGTVVRVFSRAGAEVGSSPLAADGGYDVGGLESGAYHLLFDAAPGRFRSEYWNDARRLGRAQEVVITGTGSVAGIDAVLGLAPPLRVTQRPSVVGRAVVGRRVTAERGEWDDSPLRFSYRWRADGVAIPGATERKLRITPDLRGDRLSVAVRAVATADERSPGVAVTRRTQPVRPAPFSGTRG
jgi:hypothetical protein